MREELSSTYESHNKEDLGLSLEHEVHSHEEGVVSHEENIFLQFGRLNLIVLQDDILGQGLHGVNLRRIVFLDHQEYLTERSASNHTFDFKVLKGDGHVSVLSEHGLGGFFSKFTIVLFCYHFRLNVSSRTLVVLIVVVLVLQTEVALGHAFFVRLHVLLAGSVVAQLAINSEYGQVLACGQVVNLFEALKEFITHLTDESVVVFISDMDNELPIVFRS